ncbi:hypothetical protein GP486_006651 [Trichoglossum hirsutum]|uniref:Uncharacterized protein n=1 Tax=Trichoglossum hirsutum TaxID=265104 RepID=A0A9P8IGM1_9PEZI|nr:hypothetical protein GP486_006651 [Trichoglossum hirsutum]
MSRALRGRELVPRRLKKPKEEPRQPAINICRISAAVFYLNLKKKENICFATSILEIDRELKARAPDQPESDSPKARRPNETKL